MVVRKASTSGGPPRPQEPGVSPSLFGDRRDRVGDRTSLDHGIFSYNARGKSSRDEEQLTLGIRIVGHRPGNLDGSQFDFLARWRPAIDASSSLSPCSAISSINWNLTGPRVTRSRVSFVR